MLFTSISISALSAIALLAQTSTQSMFPRPHARALNSYESNSDAIVRRDVSQAQLSQLQSEHAMFKGWMNTFFSSASASDQSVAQLKTQFQAYEGWINSFFSQAGLSAAPAAVSGTASGGSSPAISGPLPDAETAPTSIPTDAPSPPYPANSSNPAAAAAPAGTGSAGSGGSFNAQATNLQAVYYGQSLNHSSVPLSQICQGNDVDMVILAFLNEFAGPAGYPTFDFGPSCRGMPMTPQAKAKNATGIMDCPQLASNITVCQKAGKKVFLSIGGALAYVDLNSTAEAHKYADIVWQIFGGGTSEVGRPFGDVKLDGFDIDTETKKPANWDTFVTRLRSNFVEDTSRTYYIGAAPQCPIPDESIPLNAMQAMDFVWVQFYNNGPCNVGNTTFLDSVSKWSKQLSSDGTSGTGPKLLIGAPACQACGPNGYLPPSTLPGNITAVKGLGLKNFGGMMLWGGAEALFNTVGGKNYMQLVKEALG